MSYVEGGYRRREGVQHRVIRYLQADDLKQSMVPYTTKMSNGGK